MQVSLFDFPWYVVIHKAIYIYIHMHAYSSWLSSYSHQVHVQVHTNAQYTMCIDKYIFIHDLYCSIYYTEAIYTN